MGWKPAQICAAGFLPSQVATKNYTDRIDAIWRSIGAPVKTTKLGRWEWNCCVNCSDRPVLGPDGQPGKDKNGKPVTKYDCDRQDTVLEFFIDGNGPLQGEQ